MKAAFVAGRRVGRFELLRELGRGKHAAVWLGHDERLDRQVAVKLLDPQAVELPQWLQQSRAASRLTHPNIVPLFEADTALGQPMLVFEYVEGGNLAQARRGKGPMQPRDAVTLMIGVLDALSTAHAQGIVHRDLKPSNLLLAKDGRARVMDFGIAARVVGCGDGTVIGTPGYIAPEAVRGETPSPQMDVFAAGALLGEWLAGMPLLREPDPCRALYRVQHEDLALPAQVRLDDTLRAIVARAVARDPRQRYDSAAAFRDALKDWANPSEPPDSANDSGHGTLEFLLRRMKHKRDFPALGESIVRIQRIASSETESMASLSAAILKDVSLTNKLLRMVNTVHFANAGAGSISTISRAVALVGFAGIRNMALSVVLLDHMQDKGQAAQIREEFLRGLMAGTLAAELTTHARDAEETFIGAMFQNLGRMLTQYYFPEEAQQIRQSAKDAGMAAEDKAAIKVLGLSFGELGVGVAQSWDLPDTLQRMMTMPQGAPPGRDLERGVERQRWIGRIANEITDAMLVEVGPDLNARIGRIAEEFSPALGLPRRTLLGAADAARERLIQLADALGLHVTPGAPASRLLVPPAAVGRSDLESDDALSAGQSSISAGPPMAGGESASRQDEGSALLMSEALTSGIQEVTSRMAAENFKLNEVLHQVLDTMYRAVGFRRVVFCLRDPKTETLTGRFGLGEGVEAVQSAFHVPLRTAAEPDLFTAICQKGMDTLIDDASAATVAQRLPAWYRTTINAPTFLLLPMTMKGRTFALIYADHAQPGGIRVDDKQLSLLRTLRNQVVMAFRQLGS